MIITLFLISYVVSSTLTYLLMRYHFVHQCELEWSKTDRAVAITLCLIPFISLISLSIIVFANSKIWMKLGITGDDKASW